MILGFAIGCLAVILVLAIAFLWMPVGDVEDEPVQPSHHGVPAPLKVAGGAALLGLFAYLVATELGLGPDGPPGPGGARGGAAAAGRETRSWKYTGTERAPGYDAIGAWNAPVPSPPAR